MVNSLSRKKDYRESMLRNLATSLVLYEQIKTTKAKAKALKPYLERLIVKAKKNDLVSRRLLLGSFFDKNATKKVIEVLVPRYKNINSGFIKSYQIGARLGDSAPVVLLKLVPGVDKKEKDAKKIDESKTEAATVQKTGKGSVSKKAA